MSRYTSSCPLECKIYVGGLTKDATKEEIERAFEYYGKLKNVFLARNPPGFAFVEFEDSRDAEDAVRGLNGRTICGVRARVEFSHGRGRDKNPRRAYPPTSSSTRGSRRSRSRSYERRRRSYTRSKSRSRSRSRGVDRYRKRERFVNERENSPRRDSRSRSRS